MSDPKGAWYILEALPAGAMLIADRGCDANWFREAFADKGITRCIPLTKNGNVPVAYRKTLCRQRHMIENMLAKLKDCSRNGIRYHRYAHTYFSAICIAATVAFYLN